MSEKGTDVTTPQIDARTFAERAIPHDGNRLMHAQRIEAAAETFEAIARSDEVAPMARDRARAAAAALRWALDPANEHPAGIALARHRRLGPEDKDPPTRTRPPEALKSGDR